jgi:hypothetical protein
MSEQSNSSVLHPILLFLIGAVTAVYIFVETWNHTSEPARSTESMSTLLKSMERPGTTGEELEGVQRFSAIAVIDTLRIAREHRTDFLSLYIRRSLPQYVSKDHILLIEESIRTLRPTKSSPSHLFNKGMLYFFLALAETIRLVEENPVDSNRVSNHWFEAQRNLNKAGELGDEFLNELNSILRSADMDQDHSLTAGELRRMILTRE